MAFTSDAPPPAPAKQRSGCRHRCGLHGPSLLLLPALAILRGLQPTRARSNHNPDASHTPYKYVTCSQRSECQEPFLWERNHNDNTPVPAPARGGKCIINVCLHGERKREHEAAGREQAMHTKTHPALCHPLLTGTLLHPPERFSSCATSPFLQTELPGPGSQVLSPLRGVRRAGGMLRLLPSAAKQKGRGKRCSALRHGFSSPTTFAAAGSGESAALIAAASGAA